MFSVSPGVNIQEIDLTTVIPTVSTAIGALAGVFHWGPVDQRIMVDSEPDLVSRFGKPSNFNAETWFTAASYLAYSNQLILSRAANTTGSSPSVSASIESGNATATVANTSALSVGMFAASVNNSGVTVGATIASIVNSTAFTFSSASHAVANGTSEILFLSNTAFNAIANTGEVANLEAQIVKNEDHFISKEGTFDTDAQFVARFPGSLGNSLRISVCASPNAFSQSVNLASYSNASFTVNVNSNTTTFSLTSTSNTDAGANATSLKALFSVGDNIEVGNNEIGKQLMKITAIGNTVVAGNSSSGNANFTVSFEDPLYLSTSFVYDGANASTRNVTRTWEFSTLVDAAPGQSTYQRLAGNTSVNADEVHVVVVDDGGKFTGVPGTVLEIYKNLSRASDAKTEDGTTGFYRAVINDRSQYVWAVNDISGMASNTALNLSSTTASVYNKTFVLGNDGNVNITICNLVKRILDNICHIICSDKSWRRNICNT